MLGVPPKFSDGATNRCVMSRLKRNAVPGPFRPAYRSNLWDHIGALAAGPDNAGYRGLEHDPKSLNQKRIFADEVL
jgi:hypothetical protein